MNLLYVTLFQLSKYKVFIGHSRYNSILLSSWLIFNFRGKISILNLFNTIKMLKVSYQLIKYLVNIGFPIWFINFNLTKEYITKQSANNSGEFYLTRRWIRGLISNYYIITKAYRKYLIKKEYLSLKKLKDIYDKWFFTRFTWPRAIFITDIKTSYIVSKEAISSKIPIIALVDTNIKTFFYNIPIGSNDDSIESLGFINNIITQYIIKTKYKKILIWYFFNRNITRYQSLLKWLECLILFKKKKINKISIKNMKISNFINYYKAINNGLKFFFGRSYKYKLFKKKKKYNNDFFLDKFYNVNKNILYNKLKVLNYKKLIKKYRIKLKRSISLKKIEGITYFKSFLNNFIKFLKYPKRFKWSWIYKVRKVSKIFKSFFYFIYLFFLNKFNIVIDIYNTYNYRLKNLSQIRKTVKKEKEDYSIYIKDKKFKKKIKKKVKKYDIMYMFRYKNKRIKYSWRRLKKIKYSKEAKFININIKKNNIGFYFFFWKYLIISLGLKLRIKPFNFKKLNTPRI